jgi:hypothetical protein
MFKSLVRFPVTAVKAARTRVFMAVSFVLALMAVAPAASLATATPTETKVGEIATSVGSEGVEIVLAILAALVSLLVAIIIIPKAVGLIKRFI